MFDPYRCSDAAGDRIASWRRCFLKQKWLQAKTAAGEFLRPRGGDTKDFKRVSRLSKNKTIMLYFFASKADSERSDADV